MNRHEKDPSRFTLTSEDIFKINALLLKLEAAANDKGWITLQMEVLLDLLAPMRAVVTKINELERQLTDQSDFIYSEGLGVLYTEQAGSGRGTVTPPAKPLYPRPKHEFTPRGSIENNSITMHKLSRELPEFKPPVKRRVKFPNQGDV